MPRTPIFVKARKELVCEVNALALSFSESAAAGDVSAQLMLGYWPGDLVLLATLLAEHKIQIKSI